MSRSDVLVDADWVQARIDDPKTVIVEVDEDTSAYDKNHIKNAIRIDWRQDLQDPVRRDFVDQAGFEKLLSEKGIANDDTVVLYGGNNNWFASYAYWYFKLYGQFSGKLLAPAHLPQEQSQRPGHVPTARNIPWSKSANDDGTFKSDDELKELYEGEGVDLSKDTIAYCRIGERSAHTWFVLHELLGQTNVKNYDGSWTEYGSLVGVPIELGANS
ncbi:sulfurtransferase [Streptomyces sp. MCAF7]